MRLKNTPQPARLEPVAYCSQRRLYFGRVVSVIVKDSDLADRGLQHQPAVDAGKIRQ